MSREIQTLKISAMYSGIETFYLLYAKNISQIESPINKTIGKVGDINALAERANPNFEEIYPQIFEIIKDALIIVKLPITKEKIIYAAGLLFLNRMIEDDVDYIEGFKNWLTVHEEIISSSFIIPERTMRKNEFIIT